MKLPVSSLCVATLVSLVTTAVTARERREAPPPPRFMVQPSRADLSSLPSDVRARAAGPTLQAAHADTFHLAWYSFDNGPDPDPQGWYSVDLTAQRDTFFHVAGPAELDGGQFGNLLALEGSQSMWCGLDASPSPEYCGWASLPGYGDKWDQRLVSKWFDCDSIRVYYHIFWDSEPGYDPGHFEYYDTNTDNWVQLPVNGGDWFGYHSIGNLVECFMFGVPGDSTKLRFRFQSFAGWDDEDGFWQTDGAMLVDSITVECYNADTLTGTYYEDFEDESPGDLVTTDGCWRAQVRPSFGDFADLYPGFDVLQEDLCQSNFTNVWAFFDDPAVTDYSCGGHPEQGAVPFGPDDEGFYLLNDVWSPMIPLSGPGDKTVLMFDVYRDLPQTNQIAYLWWVRSLVGGCWTRWRNDNTRYYGPDRDWYRHIADMTPHIASGATHVQVALQARDFCGTSCSIFNPGTCHSHAPLFDNVHVVGIDVTGPTFVVNHVDLFQDNFAEDGTTTGTARADGAIDTQLSYLSNIIPADSVVIGVTDTDGLAGDPYTGRDDAVYAYVAVWPPGQPGKSGPGIEAPETRTGLGKRFPLVDSLQHDGMWWYCFRADSAFYSSNGNPAPDLYCFDLRDDIFTPGDTICYVFCATGMSGTSHYFSRRVNGQGENFTTDDLWEALASPMEFTILPAGGWSSGGDILYIDDADDRAGPPQLFFDTAFEVLGLKVDRYDVLGPSSAVGNSLASRVQNAAQLAAYYRKIIWSTSTLTGNLILDGKNTKEDDFSLLFDFVDQHPDGAGLYLTGDYLASDWAVSGEPGAVALETSYMNHDLAGSVPGDHVASGEPVSPCLVATGPCFTHLGVPDSLIAYGGCPVINKFDLLTATGSSVAEFTNPSSGYAYVLSQVTQNAVGDTARVILSGFSYEFISDKSVSSPPARIEHLADIIDWLDNDRPSATGVGPAPDAPRDFIAANYPNPFNPTTTIRYGVRERAHVSLRIYNVAGQLVRTLVDEVKVPRAGGHVITWDGQSNAGQQVSSGVYFYKLVTKEFTQTRKMVLLK